MMGNLTKMKETVFHKWIHVLVINELVTYCILVKVYPSTTTKVVFCNMLFWNSPSTTNCYAKPTPFGTPCVSGCDDFPRSSTTHCYPRIWFQSLVETQGLPLSVFGLSPQSILHLTSFGWTHKITVSGLSLVNLAPAMLSGASLLLKLI